MLLPRPLSRRGFLGGAGSVALATGLGSLTACTGTGGSTGAASSDKLSMFSYLDNSNAKLMDKALSGFKAKDGITVTHTTLPGSGAALYTDKLRTQLLGSTPPDAFMIWGGQIAAPFVESGQLTPLDDYYTKYKWADELNPSTLKDMTFQGKKYGVPALVANVGAWYRTDLFKKAGADVPTTYADLEKACAKLKASGVVPLATAGVFGWDAMRLFEYLLETTAGPDLHDKLLLGEVSWKNSAVYDAFGLFKKWVDKKWVPEGFLGIKPDDADNYLVQGTGAFLITGQWEEVVLNASGKDKSLFDVFVLPTDQSKLRMSGWTEGFFMANSSPNKDNTAKLYDYLLTPGAQEIFASTRTPVKGITPDAKTYPLNTKWLEFGKKYEHYTIQDQAFPKDVADSYFQIQSSIAQGKVSAREAGAQMQAAVAQWKKGGS
ncbi:ABC transporter substrate-binding protein [Streptomyces arenae]|uniref:ABC transporter substrate-binding protein n=1 Tax=Streptomyces arenae TaxID=29301 RepID=UPI002658A363|nr:ABC transporter substrate-binding protein [Streptomyces arenae]MCG7209619.1 ABC transporter substrate-binding protein [Streptomyces arenae]